MRHGRPAAGRAARPNSGSGRCLGHVPRWLFARSPRRPAGATRTRLGQHGRDRDERGGHTVHEAPDRGLVDALELRRRVRDEQRRVGPALHGVVQCRTGLQLGDQSGCRGGNRCRGGLAHHRDPR